MLEGKNRDDLYFKAMKAMFWIVFFSIVSVALVFAWPIINVVLGVLSPFIIGLILAYILHPVVRFVQFQLRLGRVAGVFVVALGLLLILGLFIAVLIPILYQQITAVVEDISRYIQSGTIDDMILERIFETEEEIEEFRQRARDWWAEILESVGEAFSPSVLEPVATGSVGAVRGTLGAIGAVFGFIGTTAITITLSVIVAFYSLIGMAQIPAIIRRLIPGPDRERTWAVMLRANEAVGGFLRGQLMACIGVGILATIFLFIIGLKKYAVLIGFTAGAVNFIPYLGPTVGATPAVLWAIFSQDLPRWALSLEVPDWGMRLILIGVVIGAFGLIQAIDGFVFQPFIVGKNATLHPLAVMLALVIGGQIGIVGMVLAVPMACIVKVVFVEYYWSHRSDFLKAEPSQKPPSGTAAAQPPPPLSPERSAEESA